MFEGSVLPSPRGTPRFGGIAMNVAKDGQMERLVAAAREHAEALRAQPGCVGAWVLVERGTSGQVSLSLFESEGAFGRALEATRPVIAKHHIEALVEGEGEFRLFDVR